MIKENSVKSVQTVNGSAVSSKITSHSRLIGLDIIRTIAILLVVWFHSMPILAPVISMPYIGTGLKKIAIISDWIGPLGVDLFFVLSGFLIGTILISTFYKSKGFGFGEVKNFWIRRWFRTIPNYYFILTIAFVLYAYLYNTRFDFRYYVFIQNFITVHPKFFGEAWSLAVEEWFYLTLPVFLLLIGTALKGLHKKVILKSTFAVYLLTFIILRFIWIQGKVITDYDSEVRKIVLFRLDSVMYGVIIAYGIYFNRDLLNKIKARLFWVGIISSLLLVSLFFWASEHSTVYKTNQVFRLFIINFYCTLIPVFFSLLIPAAYFLKDLKYPLLKRMVLRISLISYSLYLVHYTLLYVPIFSKSKADSPLLSMLYYISYWVVALLLSNINYHYFEKPVTKFRELISKHE